MSKLFCVDGNFYLHRAMSVVIKRKNPEFLVKNTFTMFLSLIASDAALLKATHVVVCLDAKRSFRHDIYKDYKANRTASKEEKVVILDNGKEFRTSITPGSLVKPVKELLTLAGLAYSHKKLYEADDLMASVAKCLSPQIRVVIGTRDKDLAASVTERVSLWWPIEKRLIGPNEVAKHFGVHPNQITDYLSLLGDAVDNIPGIPGCGPKTACKLLEVYGDLDTAIKDPKFRAKYRDHRSTLAMARKLVMLRPDVKYYLDDLIPQKVDPALGALIWSIPTNLKDLADSRKAMSMKGLFGK